MGVHKNVADTAAKPPTRLRVGMEEVIKVLLYLVQRGNATVTINQADWFTSATVNRFFCSLWPDMDLTSRTNFTRDLLGKLISKGLLESLLVDGVLVYRVNQVRLEEYLTRKENPNNCNHWTRGPKRRREEI